MILVINLEVLMAMLTVELVAYVEVVLYLTQILLVGNILYHRNTVFAVGRLISPVIGGIYRLYVVGRISLLPNFIKVDYLF